MAASPGTIWIDVKPNLEAFRQADTEGVTDVLMKQLIDQLPRKFSRADMRVVATALMERFVLLPR